MTALRGWINLIGAVASLFFVVVGWTEYAHGQLLPATFHMVVALLCAPRSK